MSMEEKQFVKEPLLKGKGTVDLLVKMACLVKHFKTLRHFAECHLADTVMFLSVCQINSFAISGEDVSLVRRVDESD